MSAYTSTLVALTINFRQKSGLVGWVPVRVICALSVLLGVEIARGIGILHERLALSRLRTIVPGAFAGQIVFGLKFLHIFVLF